MSAAAGSGQFSHISYFSLHLLSLVFLYLLQSGTSQQLLLWLILWYQPQSLICDELYMTHTASSHIKTSQWRQRGDKTERNSFLPSPFFILSIIIWAAWAPAVWWMQSWLILAQDLSSLWRAAHKHTNKGRWAWKDTKWQWVFAERGKRGLSSQLHEEKPKEGEYMWF